jgi:hypothetical protein
MSVFQAGGQISFKTVALGSGAGQVEPIPRAAGRESFWSGRPIWANPLAGEPARQWTAGWKAGLAELRAQCGEDVDPAASATTWLALVRKHRPNERHPSPAKAAKAAEAATAE